VTEKTDLVGFKIKMIDKKVNWLNLRYLLLQDLTREVCLSLSFWFVRFVHKMKRIIGIFYLIVLLIGVGLEQVVLPRLQIVTPNFY
jgi:hypothetical protein